VDEELETNVHVDFEYKQNTGIFLRNFSSLFTASQQTIFGRLRGQGYAGATIIGGTRPPNTAPVTLSFADSPVVRLEIRCRM